MPATLTKTQAKPARQSPVPRLLRERVERLLVENYDFMDSPSLHGRNAERELFAQEQSVPELPLTAWYQPTRDDEIATHGAPQLMKGGEERLMFLRFNYTKLRLQKLQS